MKKIQKITVCALMICVFNILGFKCTDDEPMARDPKREMAAAIAWNQANGFYNDTVPPSELTYADSPFSFVQYTAIKTITPSVKGRVTDCQISPKLPTGLSISATTCAISGSPDAPVQTAKSYKITASNFAGVTQATISIAVTSNGSDWTTRTMPINLPWNQVAYGNGVFVAVCSPSATSASSPDGITWTTRTMPSIGSWNTVTFGNGVFVAISTTGALAATSPDGGSHGQLEPCLVLKTGAG